MNSLKTNCLFHAANVLLLLGYSLSDVLWLRLLAAASSLIVIPYFVLQPTPMWTAIGWNAVLAAVNLVHSWRLLVERRATERGRYPTRLSSLIPGSAATIRQP